MFDSEMYTCQKMLEIHKVLSVHLNVGVESLNKSSSRKSYTKEMKQVAVRDYLKRELKAFKNVYWYQVSSKSVLYKWVSNYTSYSKLKDYGKAKKGRKTTLEGFIKIIQYFFEIGRNYQQTHKILSISYQQANEC